MPRPPIEVLKRPLDRLPDPLPIPGPVGPFDASFTPPGSKSLTNRVLPLVALGSGVAVINRPLLDGDDAQRMIAALRQLGARVEVPTEHTPVNQLRVHGVEGRWRQPKLGTTLDLGNAGTATRFLAALACLGSPDAGPITIDGNTRMRQRPIGELVDMLTALGVRVEELGQQRCPPIRIHPVGDLGTLAGELTVGATASSQFVSAIIMLGAYLPKGLRVHFTQPPTSAAYLSMTVGLMRRLGANIEGDPPDTIRVQGWSGPRTRAGLPNDPDYTVEPDASGATYFLALAAAIPGARVACRGLIDSLQGDARFVDWLERMGAKIHRDATINTITVEGPPALRGIDADGSIMPDAAMTLAALATLAEGPTTITGLRTLRVKETDRLAALRAELSKAGATVEIIQDHAADNESLRIIPPTNPPPSSTEAHPAGEPIRFDTYDDHRMAMACSIIAAVRGHTAINDPKCVAKTYPTYWSDLAGILESHKA